MVMDVLIVEDDQAIARALQAAFVGRGFGARHCNSVDEGLRQLNDPRVGALVLDLGLEDGDGMTVLEAVRKRSTPLPTVITTARAGLLDRLKGLNAGADDYLVKPFEFEELLARLRAVLRRCGVVESVDRVGNIERRPGDIRYFIDGEPLPLTPREHTLFTTLWTNRNRLVGKQALLKALDPDGEGLLDQSLDVYIHRVRRKVEGGGVAITTLRGFGYLLRAGDAADDG